MQIESNIIDIDKKTIYPACISIKDTKISDIKKIDKKLSTYILPGFIDAHIHIESSMLPPSEFAKLAVKHGTVATVSDPHEIANVLGVKGVDFMIENGKQSGFKFFFGASPCVPATPFETNGATLTPTIIEKLLLRDDIYFLSEVMNFPGVINSDKDIMDKIALSKKYKKPIDGHAPGLRGEELDRYISAGISTDHEAYMLDEAKEKLDKGMKILIREGSAAKNFNALEPLIDKYYENLMFCSDDRHPNDLQKEHINSFVKKSLEKKHDLFKVLQIACINPIKHYKLNVGMLKKGDFADFIEIDTIENFNILKTFINGKKVYEDKEAKLRKVQVTPINNFNTTTKKQSDFYIRREHKKYRVIRAIDGELLTEKEVFQIKKGETSLVMPDIDRDILLISVINRYKNSKPALSFVKGFGIKEGAIALSVAHDSHNIISVATNYEDLTKAVNLVIKNKGAIAVVRGEEEHILPLEIAGLMSTLRGDEVAEKYEFLNKIVKEMGSNLKSPFMTLSFMALLVIPKLKIGDLGLFDVEKFKFTDIYLED